LDECSSNPELRFRRRRSKVPYGVSPLPPIQTIFRRRRRRVGFPTHPCRPDPSRRTGPWSGTVLGGFSFDQPRARSTVVRSPWSLGNLAVVRGRKTEKRRRRGGGEEREKGTGERERESVCVESPYALFTRIEMPLSVRHSIPISFNLCFSSHSILASHQFTSHCQTRLYYLLLHVV
jgi:hypothetical protein